MKAERQCLRGRAQSGDAVSEDRAPVKGLLLSQLRYSFILYPPFFPGLHFGCGFAAYEFFGMSFRFVCNGV